MLQCKYYKYVVRTCIKLLRMLNKNVKNIINKLQMHLKHTFTIRLLGDCTWLAVNLVLILFVALLIHRPQDKR